MVLEKIFTKKKYEPIKDLVKFKDSPLVNRSPCSFPYTIQMVFGRVCDKYFEASKDNYFVKTRRLKDNTSLQLIQQQTLKTDTDFIVQDIKKDYHEFWDLKYPNFLYSLWIEKNKI